MHKLFLAAAVALSLSSCGTVEGSRRLKRADALLPHASGVVKFKRLSGEDTLIDLRVKRLAEPDKLTPPGYMYVAWVRGSVDDPPQNVGSLVLDKDMRGELRTITPLQRFEVFVTAESASDVEKPSGERLLWADHGLEKGLGLTAWNE
jgi:hypothetical protein